MDTDYLLNNTIASSYVVGVFERDPLTDNYQFLRIGIILSQFLVAVAGYLDFNRPIENYFVVGGIIRASNFTEQIEKYYPRVDAKPIRFIRYEDDYIGPSKFSLAIIYLQSPFDNDSNLISPIEANIYRKYENKIVLSTFEEKPVTKSNRTTFRIHGLNAKKSLERIMGGFLTKDLTRNYLTKGDNGEPFQTEFQRKEDDCINYGNFMATSHFSSGNLNFGMVGINPKGIADYKDEEVLYDQPYCPKNMTFENLVGVLPQRGYEKLINGAFRCEKGFECDGKCLEFNSVCNGINECSGNQDEMQIYCKHGEKISKIKRPVKKDPSKKFIIGIISGSISLLILFLAILCILWKVIRNKNKIIQKISQKEINEFLYGNSISSRVESNNSASENPDGETSEYQKIPYKKEKFEISEKDLKIDEENLLGKGAYGYVHKGLILNKEWRREVAVKTVNNCEANTLRSLLMEIKIFMHLDEHPNIIGFIGAITKRLGQGDVSIVLEYCGSGNLLDYIKKQRDKGTYKNLNDVNLADMEKWSWEIANGMAHLESKRIVHGDLALRNILLTANKTAKITDFGLARKLYELNLYAKQNQEPLPWRWMSIESLKDFTFSSKSDVWSYAVTIWEIFTMGSIPFSGMNWSPEFIANLENGMRLGRPDHANDKINGLLKCCWQRKEEERPTFKQILSILEFSDI